jgi:hypothetical protein
LPTDWLFFWVGATGYFACGVVVRDDLSHDPAVFFCDDMRFNDEKSPEKLLEFDGLEAKDLECNREKKTIIFWCQLQSKEKI